MADSIEPSPPAGKSAGLARLKPVFSEQAKQLGAAVFADTIMSVVENTTQTLTGDVPGDDWDDVATYTARNEDVVYDCTCNRFAEEDAACEHLWALALAGENGPMLRITVPRCRALLNGNQLEIPPLAQGVPHGAAEVAEHDELDDYEDVTGSFSSSEALSARQAKERGVAWGQLAQRVAQTARKQDDAELHYFLREVFPNDWSIVVSKRKRGAEHGPLTAVRPGQVQGSLTLDRELASLLHVPRGQYNNIGSAREVRLDTAKVQLLFARLVASGRCHLVPSLRRAGAAFNTSWHAFSDGVSAKELGQRLAARDPARGKATGNKSGSFDYATFLELPLLRADGAGAWALELALTEPTTITDTPPVFEARASLVRGTERGELADVQLISDDGQLLFVDGRIGACGAADVQWVRWLQEFAHAGFVSVPEPQLDAFLELTFSDNGVSRLILPHSFQHVAASAPLPVLELDAPKGRAASARVFFDYGGERVSVARRAALLVLPNRRALERDADSEEAALTQLRSAGFEATARSTRNAGKAPAVDFKIAGPLLLSALQAVLSAGWQVFAEGKRYRALQAFDIRVESGLDWFEVQGTARFGDARVELPQLLRQAQKGSLTVELGDGSRGVLPADWLKRWGAFADLAPKGNQALRFSSRQLGLAEAVVSALTEEPNVPGLSQLRERLHTFQNVTPLAPPPGFLGELRAYQAHGFAWLATLAKLKFGACLADDMGLGKTIQVLAHLSNMYRAPSRLDAPKPTSSARKQTAASKHKPSARPAPAASKQAASETKQAPSLVVVPRSLIDNWRAEAARFAPHLRIRTHWGADRGDVATAFADTDIVITTYGTLRVDIDAIAQLELDTVVLDEAQAIKNDTSLTAKCARRLRAAHRIAMSGTPIENHLGELWSLFEFLNPGLLAELPGLERAVQRGQASPETLKLIQRVLKPFVLRRTKAEVARDLPERSEQTLFVDLNEAERTSYNSLLRFYQASIKKLGSTDAASSTPHVLEALLRLRQAASHPGLVDKARSHEPSSKVEFLIEKLRGLAEEGHKALVFSQFTSLLAIVRERLTAEGIGFAYLDGKTKDRNACVAQFQTASEQSVFLISLKAGGVGLNLTAADYVFILDPWWNPAVEAQAIDRAHRIGQTRHVIAYRLLARNTVEERVAQLQDQKRELVAAIMGTEGAFAGRLTRGDMETLLGLTDA